MHAPKAVADPTPLAGAVHLRAKHCEAKPSANPFKFTGRGRKLAVSLYRGGHLYVKGFALSAADGKTQLLLGPLRTLPRGRYTMTIENGHEQQRKTITVS